MSFGPLRPWRPKRRFAHLRGSCLGTNSGCLGQLIMPRWPSGDGKRRSASQAIYRGAPIRRTRIMLVWPATPGGEPATMTTRSPSAMRPLSVRALSTSRIISSVWPTIGTRNVSTPQFKVSAARVSSFGVNARTGMVERRRVSRRAESPEVVNVTKNLASIRWATSSAALVITPLVVCGSHVDAVHLVHAMSLGVLDDSCHGLDGENGILADAGFS